MKLQKTSVFVSASKMAKPNTKGKNCQTFSDNYTKTWPCMLPSRKGIHYALCTICHCDISIKHSGQYDIKTHINSAKHKDNLRNESSMNMMHNFLKRDDKLSDDKVTRAECLMVSFIVGNNLPLATADKLSDLMPAMFPDSKIAGAFACKRTKTTHVVHEIAQDCKSKMSAIISDNVFGLATDGSSDRGYKNQIYPSVVRYYDRDIGRIVTGVLGLSACEGNSTGENIFHLLDKEVKEHTEWRKCIAFCSDNANVMTGKHKGVAGFLKRENSDIFLTGCTCHLCHLAASKAASQLKALSIEDLLMNIYFYVDKSSKRTKALMEFQEECGLEALKILKHTTTRWLSLANCIDRLLKMWEPLTLFFREECENMKPKKSVKQASTYTGV